MNKKEIGEWGQNETGLEKKETGSRWAESIIEKTNNLTSLSNGFEKLMELPSLLEEGVISHEALNKLGTIRFQSELWPVVEDAKKFEGFAKEKGIEIDFSEAFQESYFNMIKGAEIDYIAELEEYAVEKNVKIESPNNEFFQEAFNNQLISSGHEWLNGAGKRARKIEEYAKKNGVDVEIIGPLQQAFNDLLAQAGGGIEQVKEAEAYAEEKGVELNFDKIQEYRDDLLEKNKLYKAKNLDYYATEKGITLPKPTKEVLQKVYENILTEGGYEWIENAQKVEKYASDKGVESLKVSQEVLQQGFENFLALGLYQWRKHAEEALEYAEQNNIKINTDDAFQKAYERMQSSGYFSKIQELESYASKTEIKLNEINKEVLQNNLQGKFERALASGSVGDSEEIKRFAEGKGIELRLTNDITEIIEESYIRLLHNNKEGHAEGRRNELIEKAKIKGLNLDYDKYIKMNYLDFLNIPENERFIKSQDISIGGISVKSEFYGQIKNNKCEGKFILAENKSTKAIQLIFDSTMGEHMDISAKYDVDVIGGGWIEIDTENKKISIKRKSEKFGHEPRIVTAKVINDNFPEYTVLVESY